MDQVTIFGDIHGNLPALEAFFADAEARELNNLYCLGDLVGYGVAPNEVIDQIRTREIPTIIGNYDQGVGISSDDCGCAYTTKEAETLGKRSIAWTNAHTTDDNKAFLRENLVKQMPLQLGDLKILLVHGSPRKVNEYLYEDRPDDSLERIMDGINADVLVCGHTHIPYHKVLPSGRQIVNAGSVGKPKDDNPNSCYITLSAERNQLNVEFLHVAYDVESAATAIERTEMPDEFAQMLRDGKG